MFKTHKELETFFSATLIDTGGVEKGDTIFVGIFSSKEKAREAIDNLRRTVNEKYHSSNYFYGYKDTIKELTVDSEPALMEVKSKRRLMES